MRYLKDYNDYITEELRKLVSDSSGTGRTKWIDYVYDDEPDQKSAASGILLRDKLKREEFDDLIKIAGDYLSNSTIKYFINNPKKSKRVEKFLVTMNNLKYLKDMLKERGELRCEYCNRGPLVIYDINPGTITPEQIVDPNIKLNDKFNPKDGATCDHKKPQSKGGSKFDYSNLAVCCSPCNRRKGNKTWEEWVKIMNLKENANFKSEWQLIDDILLEIKDCGFHVEMREEDTDNPNKTFLSLRIQYNLDPEDEMWDLPRAYKVPILSNYTFKWDEVKDTILRLVDAVGNIPDIDLHFIKYAKMNDDSEYFKHRVDFVYSRGDGDDLSIIEDSNIEEDLQFVDVVFIKELK